MKFHSILLALLFVLEMSCSVHRPITAAEPMVDLPETFTAGPINTGTGQWWAAFGDAELDKLIQTGLSDNLTIGAAWNRLEQARQLAIVSGASRLPSLNLGLNGQKNRYETGSGPMGVDESTAYQATATVSWQLDLWRKIGNARKAAILDAEASRQDLEATAQTIAGSIADTWFALAAERSTLQLLSEQERASRNLLGLVEFRFSNGLASALDVYQQRSALAAVEALVPESQATVQILENTLNLLLGREPGTQLPELERLPSLPNLPATGIPAVVLRKRPDVRAAELRLIAADHRLAAAIGDRFPSFSLSYTFGGQSDEFRDILDSWFSNLVGNLTAPIFAGGRLKAEEERNRAVVEERYLNWQASLLSGWNEVENALVTEQGNLRTLEHVNGQVELARETLDRSRDQYVNGLVDYLNVLNSLQSLQRLERQLLRTKQSLLKNRVALHLALGGDWSRDLVHPQTQIETHPEETR